MDGEEQMPLRTVRMSSELDCNEPTGRSGVLDIWVW